MLAITIRENEYELATTLRVAYNIQGQHNHRSYIDIFEDIDKMTLEQQIGIVYAAFQAANPDSSKLIKQSDFLNEFLDNYSLTELMQYVKDIIAGIMGKDLEDINPEVKPVESEEAPKEEEEEEEKVF